MSAECAAVPFSILLAQQSARDACVSALWLRVRSVSPFQAFQGVSSQRQRLQQLGNGTRTRIAVPARRAAIPSRARGRRKRTRGAELGCDGRLAFRPVTRRIQNRASSFRLRQDRRDCLLTFRRRRTQSQDELFGDCGVGGTAGGQDLNGDAALLLDCQLNHVASRDLGEPRARFVLR
jgi:hypothetical protein